MEVLLEALLPVCQLKASNLFCGQTTSLVCSELDKDHGFLYPWMLSELFSSNKGQDFDFVVFLVTTEHSSTFLESSCRKRGFSFQSLQSLKRVKHFDLLSSASDTRFDPNLIIGKVLESFQSFLSLEGERRASGELLRPTVPVVIVDSLMPLLALGAGMESVRFLVEQMQFDLALVGGCLTVGLSNFTKGERNHQLYRTLAHSAHTVLYVSGLSTGQSADVDGQVIVERGAKFELLTITLQRAIPCKSSKLLLKFKDAKFEATPCSLSVAN